MVPPVRCNPLAQAVSNQVLCGRHADRRSANLDQPYAASVAQPVEVWSGDEFNAHRKLGMNERVPPPGPAITLLEPELDQGLHERLVVG